nr:16S rRNA (guanine(527)-N(7))-methyltransferase RsmG [Arthrobacter echini]
MFGERMELALRFVEHLATSGIERGLLGPREVPRLWDRHVLNCAVVSELMTEGSAVVDVGSGAGLPGLAIAIARADLRLHLVEPLERRTRWLAEVIDDLGLDNVEVHRARAEQMAGKIAGDYSTARAVSALPTLVSWMIPLTRAGGEVLAIKGRSAQEEIDKAREVVARLGGGEARLVSAGNEVLATPTTVVRIPVLSR